MATQSFLEIARDLVDDPAAKAAYAADPGGFLAERGFDGLTPEEVDDAVGLVADALPAPVALQLVGDPDGAAPDTPLARLAAAEPEPAPAPDPASASVDVASMPDPTGPIDLGGARAPAVAGGSAVAAEVAATADENGAAQVEGETALGDPADEPAPDVNAADSDFGTGAVAAVETEGAEEQPDELVLGDEPEETDVVVAEATEPPELDAPDAPVEVAPAPEEPLPDEPDEIEHTI